ncbi:TetR/AcrR family transcriptional regulator [Mycobacterium sp. NPDC003449]
MAGEAVAEVRPTSERVRRKRGRKIREILTAAAELFGERGYDAVSLDDVADRLDVTKGSLYYYFASKDELVTAAIESLGDEWTTRLEQLLERTEGTPATRLGALIREHLTIAVRDYPAALRLFLEPREWPDAQHDRIKDLRRRHDGLFRKLIEQGTATGDFRVVDLDTALQCMHAAMSQAPLWCVELSDRAQRKAIDNLTATLMMLTGPHPR